MPLHSLNYFLFLPVVYLAFYFVGERARWFVLLAASLLFYAALHVPYLVVVLVLVTMATYGFGIGLDEGRSATEKRILLWSGITVNVLILVVMKYLPFLSHNLTPLSILLSLDTHVQPVNAFVVIGVSYYVFQSISYLLDIYLDRQKPERHFGYLALYLAFFPKLLQGPIERANDLLPQLKRRYELNYDNMRHGMLLFTWGLFKKVVIADRLGLYVDRVYGDVYAFTGMTLLLATYAYAFQIYLDFSGYTDMALGSARLFNINLTQNFNSPYLARSVTDFWQRWHVTFSRWLLDYIFTPLRMRWYNWKNWGTASALVVTFLVAGIWHGAYWGFVIWGGLHGLYMAASVFYTPYQTRLHNALRLEKTTLLACWQTFVTFNLVSVAWVFFRANEPGQALYIIANMCNGVKGLRSAFLLSQGEVELGILLAALAIIGIVYKCRTVALRHTPFWIRWPLYYSLILSVLLFGVYKHSFFIYFNF